jgi:hypothetical protein
MCAANRSKVKATFTRLYAKVYQEDGAFTVSVRLRNHLKPTEAVWGEEVVDTIEMAGSMIGDLAAEFSIPQEYISIDIRMENATGGTLH